MPTAATIAAACWYRASLTAHPEFPLDVRATVRDGECELHRVVFRDPPTGDVVADVRGDGLTERAHAELTAAVLAAAGDDALETAAALESFGL